MSTNYSKSYHSNILVLLASGMHFRDVPSEEQELKVLLQMTTNEFTQDTGARSLLDRDKHKA